MSRTYLRKQRGMFYEKYASQNSSILGSYNPLVIILPFWKELKGAADTVRRSQIDSITRFFSQVFFWHIWHPVLTVLYSKENWNSETDFIFLWQRAWKLECKLFYRSLSLLAQIHGYLLGLKSIKTLIVCLQNFLFTCSYFYKLIISLH